jgi:putative oxidoreductase
VILENKLNPIMSLGCAITEKLNAIGSFFPQLALRIILAWEFGEAGLEKLKGDNWFNHIKEDFPFPFNLVPTDISWFMATWSEILGAVALLVGLCTRFWAFSLIILDIVAWYSVHAGNGYNVCDNGFKLPLLYLILLLPLLFSGPGKASMDHFIVNHLVKK